MAVERSRKVPTNRSADTAASFAAGQSGTNLTNQTGKPPFAPQKLLLINNTGAAITAGITLVVDEDDGTSGNSLAPHVPANGWIPIDVPIKTLTTPAGIITLAYWYERGHTARPESGVPTRN